MRTAMIAVLSIALSTAGLWAQDSEWETTRSQAVSQYEIVKLLIKKGKFDEVAAATEKLFGLDTPQAHEHMMVESASKIAGALTKKKQYGLAHTVLDQAIRTMTQDKSKGQLYQEKAYVCKKEGKDEEAMKFFEQANSLLSSGPPR